MKVKIIKSSHWHTGLIGCEFNVTEPREYDGYVRINEPGSDYHMNGLYQGDYEIVAEKTKFVIHEGIKYEVPSWVNFLTRDDKTSDVYAWEGKPTWQGKIGYQDATDKRRQVVVPYVEPKPEGHFFVEL